MKKLIVYTDGGARGNPGPAAIGVIVIQDSKPILETGKTIGVTTNNVAEYTAVLEALSWLIEHIVALSPDQIQFYLDSELVVRQLNGIYRVKDIRLKKLNRTVAEKRLLLGIPVNFDHIPRENNKDADALVNRALDL